MSRNTGSGKILLGKPTGIVGQILHVERLHLPVSQPGGKPNQISTVGIYRILRQVTFILNVKLERRQPAFPKLGLLSGAYFELSSYRHLVDVVGCNN